MTVAVLERPKNRKRSARSLRREIRDRLWGTDDPDVLRAILGFVRSNVPELPELPEELVKQLEEAKRDIVEGRVISNEEFMEWACLEFNRRKNHNYIDINRICYNTLADEYYTRANAEVVGKHLAQIISNVLKQNCRKDNYRILELGCGTGTILAALNTNHEYQLYAVDLSANMVSYAKKNCPEINIETKNVLDVSDISGVFQERGQFDVIIMAALIHLFPRNDAIELLNRVKEWLNPNGLIYIDTTKEAKFKDGEISAKQGYSVPVTRLRTRWTENDFKELLQHCGFDIVYEENHPAHNGKIWLRKVAKKRQ